MNFAGVGLLVLLMFGHIPSAAAVEFSAQEREQIKSFGPWPPTPVRDASNGVDGDPLAIKLGAKLFAAKAISGRRDIACASCHVPARAFQDAKRSSRLGRNTPSLIDSAHRNWFGWDGATDSLWAATLAPLMARDEMAATAQTLSAVLQRDRALGDDYKLLFGDPLADVSVLVNVSKALAAYQASLVSPRTPFDTFRDELNHPSAASHSRYPAAAQRGLKIFIGAGRCMLCHVGPSFSNGEFADIGRPFFNKIGADPGRWGGLKKLQASPYTRLGDFSDASPEFPDPRATLSQHVQMEPRNFGEFKVPSLRGLGATAPYFHDGSAKNLTDVVRHYSNLDPRRIHSDGAAVLQPLKLTQGQADDLVAFLRTLSAPSASRPSK